MNELTRNATVVAGAATVMLTVAYIAEIGFSAPQEPAPKPPTATVDTRSQPAVIDPSAALVSAMRQIDDRLTAMESSQQNLASRFVQVHDDLQEMRSTNLQHAEVAPPTHDEDDGWPDDTLQEKATRHAEARTDRITQALIEGESDAVLTDEVNAGIRSALDASDALASQGLAHVDCRSNICAIELTHAAGSEVEQSRWVASNIIAELSPGEQEGFFQIATLPDGSKTTRLFVSLNGQALPDIESL